MQNGGGGGLGQLGQQREGKAGPCADLALELEKAGWPSKGCQQLGWDVGRLGGEGRGQREWPWRDPSFKPFWEAAWCWTEENQHLSQRHLTRRCPSSRGKALLSVFWFISLDLFLDMALQAERALP